MRYLKQSTAASILLGPFVDATDGVTAETALTLAVKLSKNAAALAARSSATAIAHDADGYYSVPLNATDTGTLGRLRATSAPAGALPVWEDYTVLHASVYDVLFGSVAPSTHTAAAVAAAVAADAPPNFGDLTISGSGLVSVGSVAASAITAASIAPDALTAAKFAPDVAAELQSGLATASALAALATLAGHVDTEVTAILAKTNLIPASPAAVGSPMVLSATGLDAVAVEAGVNARQALALIGAAAAGKASGLDTTTATYYAMGAAGTVTARIVATVDADGNRTATTLTPPT